MYLKVVQEYATNEYCQAIESLLPAIYEKYHSVELANSKIFGLRLLPGNSVIIARQYIKNFIQIVIK